MRLFRTDKFEVIMMMMTALCCSVALVSCGKTAKSRDAEKHAAEVAEQKKIDDDKLRIAKAKEEEEKTAAAEREREATLKAQEEKARRQREAAQNAPTTPAPGPGKPGMVNTTPIGTVVGNKDKDKDKDKDKGTQTVQPPVPGAPGQPGAQGQQGTQGVKGDKGDPGQTLVVGGGQGQAQPGTQTTTQGGGNSVVPPGSPPGREQAGLQTDFAAEALNLLDLGQAEATWTGCMVTATTLGQPAAVQQAVKEEFKVYKTGAFRRDRQLHQGSDCALAIAPPESPLSGTIKVISREAGSTADALTYKIDLRIPTFAAPTQQQQSGTTQQQTPQETIIQQLIKIERQAGILYFGKQPEAGQPRPTTVDGAYKLRHN